MEDGRGRSRASQLDHPRAAGLALWMARRPACRVDAGVTGTAPALRAQAADRIPSHPCMHESAHS